MDTLRSVVGNCLKRNGNRTFLQNSDVSYSYSECLELTESIKAVLDERLISKQMVAVLHRSKLKGILSLLSVCLANKVYVPLDNMAPEKRNIDILHRNKLSALIISHDLYDTYRETLDERLTYSKTPMDAIDAYLLVFDHEKLILEDDIAYILFTSGSTGFPKGIKISDTNALCFINWSVDLIAKGRSLNFCSVAPLQFDLSVFDIYVSLLSGGSLFVFEEQDIRNPRFVTQIIDSHAIHVIYTTPTLYSLILRYGKLNKRSLDSLLCIIFAGEIMPYDTLDQLREKCPTAEYYNFYGPTETNVCIYFNATNFVSDTQQDIPIGWACPYDEIMLKDKDASSKGEVWVAGDSVFAGYMNLDQLNKERFVRLEDKLWYKTGDLAYEDTDGVIHYISRVDRMVKLKGYRIELNEIESVIMELRQVKSCAVVLKRKDEEDGQIVVFYEMDTDGDELDLIIKEHCKTKLTHYMIPHVCNRMEQIPLNSNSKIDYNKLTQW